jgi:hypothetical protein
LLWYFSAGDKIENCSAQFLAIMNGVANWNILPFPLNLVDHWLTPSQREWLVKV